MVVIKEYRIILPMTVQEYRVGKPLYRNALLEACRRSTDTSWVTGAGQLYAVGRTQLMEVSQGDGAGVEIITNKSVVHPTMGSGQYTEKLYHIDRRFPPWLRVVAPKSGTVLEETSTNCFPITTTTVKLPLFSRFSIRIDTVHADDDGSSPNIHNLSPTELAQRQVVYLDIAANKEDKGKKMYDKDDADPGKFKSVKTGRGPLLPGWQQRSSPVMCAYKLVYAEFDYWGLQGKVEEFIHSYEEGLFLTYHRQLFCWIDTWHGHTMDDIRHYEKEVSDRANLLTSIRAGQNSNIDPKTLPEILLTHISPPPDPAPPKPASSSDGGAAVPRHSAAAAAAAAPAPVAAPPQEAAKATNYPSSSQLQEAALAGRAPNSPPSQPGDLQGSMAHRDTAPPGDLGHRDKDEVPAALILSICPSNGSLVEIGRANSERAAQD